ncbi:TIGR03620 family F420-dependent LLM class oxidoreductase [Streptomyces luteireticuli]|uniref:TIGR03620 family F420-dependent LLM class oxidoreductase n=1 Tax=Streptomyces luteireticuli TaxID=173858 RepID=UPI0035584CFB
MAPIEGLGPTGIWSMQLRADDADQAGEIRDAAAELDELGFTALWIGGSPSPAQAAHVLAATRRAVVGTSILSIWQHEAADVAARYAALDTAARERFVLGLGVSHAKLAAQYARPYSAMRDYLAALDDAPTPVPADRRVLAALGPKMLHLARDRAAGAIPYLATEQHTAEARALLGDGPFLAPELPVVLDTDLPRARETARGHLRPYLGLPNYTANFARLGFTEDDFTGGGSDRLIDTLFALGDTGRIRARVEKYLAAGADHVAVQVVADGQDLAVLRRQWRELAGALPLERGAVTPRP